MQGKIADFSIPEIFQLVASQGKSGSLRIRTADRETVFLFSDGGIVDVQPDRRSPGDMIGSMLVDAGLLTEEELKRILAAQEKAGRRFGEILVEKGKVSNATLSRYLNLQVREILFETLNFKDGDYRFEGFAVRIPPWIRSPIRTDVLMMEGMQYLDEYPIVRGKFPPGDFLVTRKRGEKIDPHALPEEERTVWNALDFSSEPRRVFRKACITWFEGVKALWLLLDRGLIEISVQDEARVDPGAAIRAEIAKRSRIGWIRAAAWAVAAGVAFLWAYTILLSPRATAVFAAWAVFF